MIADRKYIRYIEIYLCGTLFLYFFGIWDFHTRNQTIFITLLVFYHLALFIGYEMGNKVSLKSGRKYSFFDVKNLRILLIINIFMVLLNSVRMAGLSSFNINELFYRFIHSFSDFTAGYKSKMDVNSGNVFLGTIGTLILYLWSFLGYAVIPLGFYHYKELDKTNKILLYINVGVTCVGAIVIGTNKRIIDMAILILLYFFILIQDRKKNDSAENKNKRKKRNKYILLSVIVAFSVMFLANKMVGSRGIGTYWNASFYKLGGQVNVDQNSVFLKIFPTSLHSFLAILCSYFSQGYYGLSLTINDGLIRTDIGLSSLWIVDNFDLNQKTLQYAAEQRYGWDSRQMWHSAYTWIANDFGLIGTIFVIFIIGLVFSLLIRDYKQEKNPVVFVLIYYFITLLIFLPCNLQIFQDAYGFIGFWTFLILWIVSHVVRRR